MKAGRAFYKNAGHTTGRVCTNHSRPRMFNCIYFCIMGVLNQLAEYLFLKKKDPNRPKSKWIGYMHGINRFSLLLFLLCLVILAIKLLR